MLVRNVVRQLQFMERHDFLHPLLPSARRVRVDVHPLRHFGIGFSRHHPARVMELVSAIVHGNGVHEQDVLGALVQTRDTDFEWREHASERKRFWA